MSLAACEPVGARGCRAGRFAVGCGARPLLLEKSKRVKVLCTHNRSGGGSGGPGLGIGPSGDRGDAAQRPRRRDCTKPVKSTPSSSFRFS